MILTPLVYIYTVSISNFNSKINWSNYKKKKLEEAENKVCDKSECRNITRILKIEYKSVPPFYCV